LDLDAVWVGDWGQSSDGVEIVEGKGQFWKWLIIDAG